MLGNTAVTNAIRISSKKGIGSGKIKFNSKAITLAVNNQGNFKRLTNNEMKRYSIIFNWPSSFVQKHVAT